MVVSSSSPNVPDIVGAHPGVDDIDLQGTPNLLLQQGFQDIREGFVVGHAGSIGDRITDAEDTESVGGLLNSGLIPEPIFVCSKGNPQGHEGGIWNQLKSHVGIRRGHGLEIIDTFPGGRFWSIGPAGQHLSGND